MYLATDVVQSLLDRGAIPPSTEGLTTSRLLALLDEELQGYVTSLLREVGEGYLATSEDFAVAAGATRVRFPSRAVANGVRRVEWLEAGATEGRPLSPLRPGAYVVECMAYTADAGGLTLTPAPTTSGILRLTYLRRPARLVETEDEDGAPQVGTAASAAASTVTCAGTSLPADFVVGARVDFVRARPPFDVLAADVALTAVAGQVLTVAEVPDGFEAGDYVCPADTSPVPQVPLECHPLLAQRLTWVVLQAVGDARAGAAAEQLADMERRVRSLLQPRDEGGRRYVRTFTAPAWGMRRLGRRW